MPGVFTSDATALPLPALRWQEVAVYPSLLDHRLADYWRGRSGVEDGGVD